MDTRVAYATPRVVQYTCTTRVHYLARYAIIAILIRTRVPVYRYVFLLFDCSTTFEQRGHAVFSYMYRYRYCQYRYYFVFWKIQYSSVHVYRIDCDTDTYPGTRTRVHSSINVYLPRYRYSVACYSSTDEYNTRVLSSIFATRVHVTYSSTIPVHGGMEWMDGFCSIAILQYSEIVGCHGVGCQMHSP